MSADAKIATHAENIQAIVGSAFPTLRKCTYLLLRVTDAANARNWIRCILDRELIKTVSKLHASDKDTAKPHDEHLEMMMLAFTYQGLQALGINQSEDYPFPTTFQEGMTSEDRGKLLRDGDHESWSWGDTLAPSRHDPGRQRQVHILAAHYSCELFGVPELFAPALLQEAGLEVVEKVDTCPSYLQTVKGVNTGFEPFGFRDGIAQPVIKGLRESTSDDLARQKAGDLFADREIAAGEFILGLPNEYDEIANCPDVQGWPGPGKPANPQTRFGLDGSYLVVRKIRQDVTGFRQFDAAHPAPPSSAPSVTEKMIGRRKSGDTLVQCPVAPPELDAFRYAVADQNGFQCPRGAHVRRANPRDTLGPDVESGVKSSKLHRLLRRGRVYAGAINPATPVTRPADGECSLQCGEDECRQDCGQGLFFIALNADLERQFELVQQRWINDTQFGDLADEDDPILGPAQVKAFSIPGIPVGRRIPPWNHFTEVLAGGYFFLPSMQALHFIGREPDQKVCSDAGETAPEAEAPPAAAQSFCPDELLE
jgi:putative iron-dependent peroxidase